MTKKEAVDSMLAKVDADKKEAFIAELREAKTPDERFAVAKKYNATLSEEEVKAFKEAGSNKLSDDELDGAAGGCGEDTAPPTYKCSCSCYCGCV